MKTEIFSGALAFKNDPFEDTDPKIVLRRNQSKRCSPFFPVCRKLMEGSNFSQIAKKSERGLGIMLAEIPVRPFCEYVTIASEYRGSHGEENGQRVKFSLAACEQTRHVDLACAITGYDTTAFQE